MWIFRLALAFVCRLGHRCDLVSGSSVRMGMVGGALDMVVGGDASVSSGSDMSVTGGSVSVACLTAR